ncbi:uncharacterized protein LOC110025726 isoform X2 [Phalaenopsis equestris]|nr:uncharacterized protein LOC110025726 isoform X2 [Phalaenopsis equestris]XP_020582015.1 uncharacterized protein LOC110025726 isoform X2 [Phalaenopsis equestris]
MVEASHSTPIKKREKYARREDAILHALGLEKQQLELQKESTSISCHAANKTLCLSEREPNHCSSEANQESQMPTYRSRNFKRSVDEDDKHETATHNSVEDASCDVVKLNGKLYLSVAGGNSDITDDDHSDLLLHGGQNSRFINQAVTDTNFSVFKRKTLLPNSINDNPAKRRDRRRPLVKVLQNSTELPVSYSFQPHHDPSGKPLPAEELLLNAQKNTIHPSPHADIPLDHSIHSWKCTPTDSGNAFQLQQPGCMSGESTPSGWTEENDFDSSATNSEVELVEEKLRSGITQPLKQTAKSPAESGMSHWHLKGRRNNRIISKKFDEYADGKNLNGTDKPNVQFTETTTSYNIGKFDSATKEQALEPEFSSGKEINYDTEEEDEEIFTGLGTKRDDSERQHSDYVDSDDKRQFISMTPLQLCKAYWEDPEDNLDQFYSIPYRYGMFPVLIDVDLKVQARYRGQHAPLVSLMSKLNGMAIVGHSVQIEVLEDGSSDLLLPSNEFEDAPAPPIWRTAKRTSMHRLPRSNQDRQNNSSIDDKSLSNLPALQVQRKRIYHAHRSPSGRFQRKPLKTVSLSSSQKTRALSSFVSEKKNNGRCVFLGGLIKADGSMPPITCIPMKVVFSRILESVGRPSAAVTHRAIAAIAAERGPS